jgi:hypothetical protein
VDLRPAFGRRAARGEEDRSFRADLSAVGSGS